MIHTYLELEEPPEINGEKIVCLWLLLRDKGLLDKRVEIEIKELTNNE